MMIILYLSNTYSYFLFLSMIQIQLKFLFLWRKKNFLHPLKKHKTCFKKCGAYKAFSFHSESLKSAHPFLTISLTDLVNTFSFGESFAQCGL